MAPIASIKSAEPEIIELIGTPAYFADGWVLHEGLHVCELIFYVTRGIEHREVVRVHVPRAVRQ